MLQRVILGNVKGSNGKQGERGNDGQKGDRGTSLRMRGNWTSGVQYVNDAKFIDIVYYKGSSYSCKNTITSSNTPDSDPTNWGKIATGVSRIVANIRAKTADFSYLDDNYIATYHYAQGTFPQGSVVNAVMDQADMLDKGLRFGGVQNDVVVIYCDTPSNFTIKVYCDLINTEIVTPI